VHSTVSHQPATISSLRGQPVRTLAYILAGSQAMIDMNRRQKDSMGAHQTVAVRSGGLPKPPCGRCNRRAAWWYDMDSVLGSRKDVASVFRFNSNASRPARLLTLVHDSCASHGTTKCWRKCLLIVVVSCIPFPCGRVGGKGDRAEMYLIQRWLEIRRKSIRQKHQDDCTMYRYLPGKPP
jgi:hypothetical protein